jgi:putative ABC transport system ATP-binding protein
MSLVIETKELTKTYQMGDIPVHALMEVNLEVQTGEFLAVMGASGSGKSTLLNLLGCLDEATSGEYLLDGKAVSHLNKKEYADIRNQKIGFVFQGFNLLPRTSAFENVELPLIYDRENRITDHKKAIREALGLVGLEDRMDHLPQQLSGGQQQRVAIARALVNEPAIILADEPTGNLDSRSSFELLSVFQELNNQGITIILVTHENNIAACTKRIVELKDGFIVNDASVEVQKDALEFIENL